MRRHRGTAFFLGAIQIGGNLEAVPVHKFGNARIVVEIDRRRDTLVKPD